MKHIKLFESFEDIDSICRKYGIVNYTINPDGSVDVDGDVNLDNGVLIKLPLRFRNVSGDFHCSYNQLTTLEGAPREVGRGFSCSYNKLTTLEGAPERVGGSFYFYKNPIYTLYKLFNNYKEFMDSLDWDYIRGNKIVMSRFEEACEEAGIEVPESIEGYKYI